MLNVDTIKNGLVIDHIKAGYGPKIFSWLGLDKADFCVALIMNAPSKTHGRKDIIKIHFPPYSWVNSFGFCLAF